MRSKVMDISRGLYSIEDVGDGAWQGSYPTPDPETPASCSPPGGQRFIDPCAPAQGVASGWPGPDMNGIAPRSFKLSLPRFTTDPGPFLLQLVIRLLKNNGRACRHGSSGEAGYAMDLNREILYLLCAWPRNNSMLKELRAGHSS